MRPGLYVERRRGCEREHTPHDRRDHRPDRVEHMVHDRDLVADEICETHHADDPEDERIADVVPRRRQVDQVRVAVQQPDGEQRDVRVQPGGRREAERREIASDPFHGMTLSRERSLSTSERLQRARAASISLMRALTSFLTSVAGSGLPIGNRMVPFETS